MTLQPYHSNLPIVGTVKEEPLTQQDYERLKASLTTYRDILIAKMLRNTGLRILEMLRTTPAHVVLSGPDTGIQIARGKKRDKKGQRVVQWETVWLHPALGVELREYIKGNAIPASQRIFPITDRQVRNVFYAAGEKAIGRRVHPHEFRGLYIKFLIDSGAPVEVAAAMVGHEDTKTTMKHYYDLSAAQRQEIQRRIPV